MRQGRCLLAGGALGLNWAEPRVTELAAAVVTALVSWSGTRWSRFFPCGAPSTARRFGTCLALRNSLIGCAGGRSHASVTVRTILGIGPRASRDLRASNAPKLGLCVKWSRIRESGLSCSQANQDDR